MCLCAGAGLDVILSRLLHTQVEEAVQRSGARIPDMLAFCFDAAQNLVSSRHFRAEVLNTLVKVRRRIAHCDATVTCGRASCSARPYRSSR
jgi:hypothetical protein